MAFTLWGPRNKHDILKELLQNKSHRNYLLKNKKQSSSMELNAQPLSLSNSFNRPPKYLPPLIERPVLPPIPRLEDSIGLEDSYRLEDSKTMNTSSPQTARPETTETGWYIHIWCMLPVAKNKFQLNLVAI